MNRIRDDRFALKFWIWISAAACVGGWLLSAVHQLNLGGYLLVGVLTLALGVFARREVSRRAVPTGRDRSPTPKAFGAGGLTRRFGKRASVLECGPDLSGPLSLRRFRRPLPLLFLILAILVFISGIPYPPTNHMGLTYRVPRVLHWLADHHWSWVHTPDPRINDRACDNEWMIAPILLFTRSDRALFILNFIPFLLLPGLVFSTWTRLGVRPRVAWNWMWLLPTGYVFLLQAASISNDAFPTVYALAAVDFALRARRSRRFSDLAYSVISIALLTGSKGSNLPLLLPWAIAFCAALPAFVARPYIPAGTKGNIPGFPSLRSPSHKSLVPSGTEDSLEAVRLPGFQGALRYLRLGASGLFHLFTKFPVWVVCILLISATVSFLPTALLNINYCGDWSGAKLEKEGMAGKNWFVGIWGNSLLFLNNFVPPVFPKAKWWNAHALEVLPKAVTRPMNACFEHGYWELGEIPTEDWVGIGFGLSVLLVISVIAAPFSRRGKVLEDQRTPAGSRSFLARSPFRQVPECGSDSSAPPFIHVLLIWSPWISLAAYAMKSGMVEAPRLIAPYYPVLFPALLISCGQSALVRKRWWRALALGLAVLSLPVLIVSPERPLWPAKTVLTRALAKHPNSQTLARALSVYTVYGRRSDPLANVRALLPQDVKVVGFMGTEDDMPISLWRPFFHRRVQNILVSDSPEAIRKTGIQYIVVSGLNLEHHDIQLKDWLNRVGAELIESTTATVKVSDGPQPWYIVRLIPTPG